MCVVGCHSVKLLLYVAPELGHIKGGVDFAGGPFFVSDDASRGVPVVEPAIRRRDFHALFIHPWLHRGSLEFETVEPVVAADVVVAGGFRWLIRQYSVEDGFVAEAGMVAASGGDEPRPLRGVGFDEPLGEGTGHGSVTVEDRVERRVGGGGVMNHHTHRTERRPSPRGPRLPPVNLGHVNTKPVERGELLRRGHVDVSRCWFSVAMRRCRSASALASAASALLSAASAAACAASSASVHIAFTWSEARITHETMTAAVATRIDPVPHRANSSRVTQSCAMTVPATATSPPATYPTAAKLSTTVIGSLSPPPLALVPCEATRRRRVARRLP